MSSGESDARKRLREPEPTGVQIRLVTRCGCEKIFHVAEMPLEVIVPLPPSREATADEFRRIDLDKLYEPRPVKCENRRFRRAYFLDRRYLDVLPVYLEHAE